MKSVFQVVPLVPYYDRHSRGIRSAMPIAYCVGKRIGTTKALGRRISEIPVPGAI